MRDRLLAVAALALAAFVWWQQQTLEDAVESFTQATMQTIDTAIREMDARVGVAIGDAMRESAASQN